MFISQIKKLSLTTALAILSLNIQAKTPTQTDEGVLNRVLTCSPQNPCNLLLKNETGYAYSATFEGCVVDYQPNNQLIALCTDNIKVECGTSDPVLLENNGDNVLCGVGENMYIYGGKEALVPALVSIHLLPGGLKGNPGPKGDKGDSGTTSWSTIILSSTISSLSLLATISVIALIIYKCMPQNDQTSPLLDA